jgi:hypothetical protein
MRLLAGPIVRRVEPTLVAIWVATDTACALDLDIYNDAQSASSLPAADYHASSVTIRAGDKLHFGLAVLDMATDPTPLEPEKVYYYNLTFTPASGGGSKTLQTLDLLTDKSDPAKPHLALGYANDALPSFVLPPRQLKDLKILHGSCRRVQYEKHDAMQWIDDFLVDTHTDPVKRPHQLFLTGDQIYADNLPTTMQHILTSIANDCMGVAEMLPGMPAERWWQFEDARVDFGSIDTLPGDSAALVLLQFAITYGNDWLVIPVPVSVGSLCRVTSLTVTDSFGVPASVPPFSASTGAADGWRMFTVAARGEPDLLFVPPSAEAASPRTIETVSFARDEMANMGWAIEKKVLDAAGRVIDRTRVLPPPEEHYGADALDYRLVTAVPENWIPLVPVSDPVSARVRLRRAVMAVTGAPPPRPLGEVVGSGTSLVINDEELPRSGATVSRTLQYVRWIGGSTQFWLGRRKDAGQGEASSGLQFDTAQPRDAGSPPTG